MRHTLHHSRVICRELDGVVTNFHMDLVGEGDAFEKLLNGSRGAGDGAKDRRGLGWAGRRHDLMAEFVVANRTGCRSYTGIRQRDFGRKGLVYDVCCAIVQPAPSLWNCSSLL